MHCLCPPTQVPSLEGQLDSWQFDVLVDVIQNALMVPLPHVSGSNSYSPHAVMCDWRCHLLRLPVRQFLWRICCFACVL